MRDTELKERKTKDAHKSQLLHEWRQLAESRLVSGCIKCSGKESSEPVDSRTLSKLYRLKSLV